MPKQFQKDIQDILSWCRDGELKQLEAFVAAHSFDVNFQPDKKVSGGWGNRGPVILAAKYGHQSTLQFLLSLPNANPDLQDDLSNTALLYASQRNHPECVETLLKANANANIQGKGDPTGKLRTPREFAEQAKNSKIVELFDEYDIQLKIHRQKLALVLLAHKRCEESRLHSSVLPTDLLKIIIRKKKKTI